mgnify:CR=1 FL=1
MSESRYLNKISPINRSLFNETKAVSINFQIEGSLVIVVLHLERLLIVRVSNFPKGKRPLILIKELRHTFVSTS